jgi:DNA-binding transcriptional MerR regulator
MKTGKVAKLFGIDPKTVTGWVDEFAEFFSPDAKGEDSTQREYLPEDLIVLNTIKVERVKRSEVEQIRAILASGHREVNLPPQASVIGGEAALAVYAQMKELEVKLEEYSLEIERLRQKNEDDWKRANEQMRIEREANQAKIEQLIEEKTEWRMRYQALKKRIGETDDDE